MTYFSGNLSTVLKVVWFLLSILAFVDSKLSKVDLTNYDIFHPSDLEHVTRKRLVEGDDPELDASFWIRHAQETVLAKFSSDFNTNVAKNVIIFLGDGMSIPTISAARVYAGGEETQLSFEKFPYTALSKTYCVDSQVADSACTATAYLGGVKGNLGTIGVTATVLRNDCSAMINQSTRVDSIARWFQLEEKKTGLVTTARVTHASPAGVYAHVANRDWESDADVVNLNGDPLLCPDIAHQLIYSSTGKKLNVIMGGGRENFLSKNDTDDEGLPGKRLDNENLIEKWLRCKEINKKPAEYVWNRSQVLNVSDDTEYLLGLFASSHVDYNMERDPEKTPSLAEMTEAAIKILDKGDNGYFLFVEGARIDMAHHESMARKAFNETLEFAKAIELAANITNEDDTLIIVTSDHAHTMSFSGYPVRGNDVLGIGGKADDGLPYTTLNYANGPGYHNPTEDGTRYDISADDLNDPNYRYSSIFPMSSETHGGDDVAVFARGPWAHLFTGVIEENVIPHLAAFASCVGSGYKVCDFLKEAK